MQRRADGFTLIELLVVIGLIAALAALLLPMAQQARGAAHSTTCRSNLQQIGHALSLYMDDNDDFIPRRGQGKQKLFKIDRMSDWFNCLPPYAGEKPYYEFVGEGGRYGQGDHSIFMCPAARDTDWLHFLPYAMNMYLSPWIRKAPHRITEMPVPSRTVFMADGEGSYSATVPSAKPYGLPARHGGNANLIFLDSHVGSFDGDTLGCGTGDPNRPDVRWQTGTGGTNQKPVE